MIVDGISLIMGGIFGFILGIALIKEHYSNLCHEYKEDNIRLQYEVQMLKYVNERGCE